MPGTWQSLNNPPGVNIDAMLLLTDGAIMKAYPVDSGPARCSV
jgi:hypothetical protein